MKYASILLISLALLAGGCPTTEPAATSGGDGGDADAGSGDLRPRPDLGQDQLPVDPDADAGAGDAALDADDAGDLLDAGDDAPTNQPPVARAVERIDTRVGDTATFDGSTSSDPDGDVVAWTWDFGDGATDEGAIATHVYDLAGVRMATLTVEDDDGATDMAEIEVRVLTGANQPPTAVIGLPSLPIPVGQEVSFDALSSSDPDGSLVAYHWEFRDAGSGTTLSIGNGTSVSRTFDEVGEVEVRLTVTDNQGADGSDVETVPVAAVPVAAFTVSPDPAEVGQTVTFDASSSTAAAAPLVAWDWDFDDGASASGETTAHTFGVAGSYDVTLTVTDDDGLVGSTKRTLVVNTPANTPVADAGADQVVLLGAGVTLTGSGSDSDGTLVSWLWDFGDGASSPGQSVSHTYAAPGTFTATLTVTDDDGLTGTDTLTVIVHRRPVAVITVVTPVPVEDAPISFSGLSSSDPDGDALTTFFWTFGDGTSATGAEVTHTYADPATYTVGLSVTDALGATGSTSLAVAVDCAGDCGATGDWRVRPFDSEDTATGACNTFIDVTVGPATCAISQSGTSLTMDCGGGFVYTGTRNGDDTFDLYLPSATVPGDPFYCGDAYFSETVTGSFVSPDRWEGQSELYVDFEYWDPWDCLDCLFEPFLKTGTRL